MVGGLLDFGIISKASGYLELLSKKCFQAHINMNFPGSQTNHALQEKIKGGIFVQW
jgi:hypothetical protein